MDIADLKRRYSGHRPGILGATEHYAVLVPVVEWAGATQLLFEVRAQNLHRQPGEVCFPGGRAERGEDPVACALRETWEELGIPAAAVEVIAPLDVVHHQGSFVLHPILARVDAEAVAQMVPSPAEVAETFLVPLDFFGANPPVVYTYPLRPVVGEDFPYDLIDQPDYPWRDGRVEVPIYRYEGRAIWGMTGRIVQALVEG